MRLLSTFSLLLLSATLVAGCDRAFTADIESETPPELHVFVRNAEGAPVAGADVSLFRSAEDSAAGTNAFHTAASDGEGRVVATAEDLGEPGVVYVSAASGELRGQGATPYVLLTDGITYFNVTVN